MVVEGRTDGIFEAGQDVVPDNGATADDLRRTVGVAAACCAFGKIDRHAGGTAGVDDCVDAGAAIEIVLTGAADDGVVAGFTIQDVAIVAAVQYIVAAAPVEIVAAAPTPKMICGRRPDEAVDAVIRSDQVLDAVECVS
jgi:hypothetical protein